MPSEATKKFLIVLMLGLLTAAAFLVRLENFKNSHARSIDEVVYYRMAEQIDREGLSGYQTIPYGQEMAATGRPLPKYFFEPLFKHPPVFTFLAVLSMKIFGPTTLAAEYVSLLSGVLMIPLVYLLGTMVFDRKTAIFSSFLLWMDPVNIICSQKIWMETTIAFFTLAAVTLLVAGIKHNKDYFFLLSGLASAAAVNTKYPGVLVTVAIALFALFYQRNLFSKKSFIASLLLPPVLLFPWFYWNYRVYGLEGLVSPGTLHQGLAPFYQLIPKIMVFIAPLAVLLWIGFRFREKIRTEPSGATAVSEHKDQPIHYFSVLFFLFLLFFFLKDPLWHSLQFGHIPRHSWSQGLFIGESPLFYFGQLMEFSLVYLFAFASLFLYHKDEKPAAPLIRLSAFIILMFFIIWGSYQSRYIVSAIPFLLLLSANFIFEISERLAHLNAFLPKVVLKFGLLLFIGFALLKTLHINVALSYPNDLCYF